MAKLAQGRETVSDLPEDVRSLFAKGEDGKFYPIEDEPDEITTAELARARGEVQTLRKRAQKSEKDFADLKSLLGEDFDAEKFREQREAAAEAERKSLQAKGDWEAREKQMRDRHNSELAAKDELIAKYKGQRDRLLVEDAALQAIVGAKGAPKLLLGPIKDRLRVVEDDVRPFAQVVDEHGSPMVSDGKGTPYTIARLLDDFKANDDYARAFDAPAGSGSGSDPSAGGRPVRGGQNGLDPMTMSGTELLKNIRAGKIPSGLPEKR